MSLRRELGFNEKGKTVIGNKKRLLQYINLKLAAKGYPYFGKEEDNKFLEIAEDLILSSLEKDRLLSQYLCPADKRIQDFLDKYFKDVENKAGIRLPSSSLVLDRHGIARVLSIPPDNDEFSSSIIKSYRLKQGILHNPKNDRRTTKGVFHIAEGGLPIPDDKKAVPKATAERLISIAFNSPKELMELPYTSSQEKKAELFVSLLLRPKVVPEVLGISAEKSLEIRFFAPGNLVSNLDFVESIFGNAGDPYLPKNDAALDIEHWTGHTGCVILAPHLIKVTKKELGLPHKSEASERQIRDGMFWENEDEKYNDGGAFKLTVRTEEGVIVTVIADNYYGYSKKEIKTQIGYSANLYGNCEEEHAGGALAFPSYNLGDSFYNDSLVLKNNHKFDQVLAMYPDLMHIQPEGYGIDKNFDNIIYVPEDTQIDLSEQKVWWDRNGEEVSLKLLKDKVYVLPEGYKVKMAKNENAPSWRLIGTVAEGTFCHKPCTVSGGGKSEISKSISDAIISGPFFVADINKDFSLVDEVIQRDYSCRFIVPVDYSPDVPPRGFLSNRRSVGSAIKLLTPSPGEYTDKYNEWLEGIPQYVKGLVLIIKRFYKPEWGDNWREHFTVDVVDGKLGNELKFNSRKLIATYLRVGLEKDGSWRTYKLRQDYVAAEKIQMEDDITASVVVPAQNLEYINPDYKNKSLKFVKNCEYRFFQRPDEAINRGYDKQAEIDLSSQNSFISNFEPLDEHDAINMMEDAIGFDQFTDPMKNLIKDFVESKECKYFVSSAHPRIVDGKLTKNVRYLQNRPDIVDPFNKYLGEIGTRLFRKIPMDKPVYQPVNAVLPGRRNNPPEPGIRPLAVYNPIHYQELPELFMEFICSLTGKSPSTTGVGSEGALTKAPFNALSPVTDLNNALVSFILTGYSGFSTAAGYIGKNIRIDHDISLLIPEIWCRLSVDERDPEYMIKEGHLEKLEDFEHEGKTVYASRLGYRITHNFVKTFFGRVFENPTAVFSDEILQPESQSKEVFVDGINNIVEAQERVAKSYFNDGSINAAIPPLKALLHIMVNGKYEGMTIDDPEIRKMFERDYVLESDWYKDRLMAKQLSDIALWQKHIKYLENFLQINVDTDKSVKLEIKEKLATANETLKVTKSPFYLKSLIGTIGLDLLHR
ncbi:MAG: hypothetical protein JEY94_03505 [Melioribacteraceae bacterium]|nr:hypothetical protein [Melioribacteraceae bacterium]